MSSTSLAPNATHSALLQAIKAIIGEAFAETDFDILDTLTESENDALNGVIRAVVQKDYLAKFLETEYQVTVDNPRAAKAVPSMTILCHNCNTIVNLPPPDTRWYSIAQGARVGWVRGWEQVKRIVLHVPDNKFCYYATEQLARKAFIVSLINSEVGIIVQSEVPIAYEPIPSNDGWLCP